MTGVLERRKEVRDRLCRREKIFGACVSSASPAAVEVFCRAGVDFVWIDLEHTTVSLEQAQTLIAAAQSGGALGLPRIASHNMETIKRILDAGADGLIVPMVNTVEESEAIIRWSKYPPAGARSFGMARAQGYGFDFTRYTQEWNDSSLVIVQIESTQGVENIDGIMALPQIDGVLMGPYDMSGSMGIPGQVDHPRIKEACRAVAESCRRHGKACGIQVGEPDPDSIRRAFDDGYTFVVLSSDTVILWKWAQRMSSLVKSGR